MATSSATKAQFIALRSAVNLVELLLQRLSQDGNDATTQSAAEVSALSTAIVAVRTAANAIEPSA